MLFQFFADINGIEALKILVKSYLLSFINITERFYFYPIVRDKPIMRVYDYDNVESNNFNTTNMSPIIIHNKKLYQVED